MKKSFADCSTCSLYGNDGKICETNTPNNLSNLDELYIIDSISDWNQLKIFLDKKSIRYLITSPLLCTLNSSISDDEKFKIAEHCKPNTDKIISVSNAKKIILIGSVSKKLFNGVEIYDDLNSFIKYYTQSKNTVSVEPQEIKASENVLWNESISNKKIYTFQIPDKYYTDQYRLVDIQSIAAQNRVVYIFRDSKNKKEYYEVPIKQNDFYWYESASTDNHIIEPYEKLELVIGNYRNRNLTSKAYGADINLSTLHSVDYYLQNKKEADAIRENILFFDIEVYTAHDKIFPDPAISAYPISAFSFTTDDSSDPVHVYLLKNNDIDSKIDNIIESKKYKHLTVFTSESALIDAFLNKLNEINPDFLCAWNGDKFDIPYIVGRMKKLKIPMDKLSPFGNVYADTTGRIIISGYVSLDQLKLFKELTYITLPSYNLNYVAQHVLKEGKVEFEGNLNDLYRENIDKFIEYSIKDTDLLRKIDNRVHHVALQDELRKVTTTAHSGAASTLGQAEGLFMTSMKKMGLIARNTKRDSIKENLPGAYVFDARGGLYSGILCDFDFTSLYPSIINTWNIGPDTFLAVIDEDVMFDYIYHHDSLKDKKISVLIDPIHNQTNVDMTLSELDDFVSKNNATLNSAGTMFKGHDIQTSIYNTVINMLFNGRKEYKKLMLLAKEKKDKKEVEYDGKQMAYKILANSLYGALANEHFKFYNNNLAKSITLTGQELLKYCAVHCDNYIVSRGKCNDFKMIKDFQEKVTNTKEVIYGDTDSLFVYLTEYLKDKSIERKKSPEVLNEIEKIQSYINNVSLPPFMNLHKIPNDKSMIFLKNEFLFSKYYTLSGKKHYASVVISQEGKDINFIDIKGLEIKRSEIPQRSQKFLNELLSLILSDNFNNKDIDALVEKTKKEMLELAMNRDNSVARIVSYSKPLSEYKKMPQHIKAMLMWNLIVNDDFRQGNKGRLWNILGIDLERAPERVKDNFYKKFLSKYSVNDLDCICLPEDVDRLPEYFIPDIKNIVSYACDDRASNLLEPLIKQVNDVILF